jgi:hypothetical protein
MNEQAITNMEYDDFLALIDGYIERSTQENDEMPASVFFELLFKANPSHPSNTDHTPAPPHASH